jgi:hypothetical protein
VDLLDFDFAARAHCADLLLIKRDWVFKVALHVTSNFIFLGFDFGHQRIIFLFSWQSFS